MKASLMAGIILTASLAIAQPVPLTLNSVGESERIVPQSIEYQAARPAVAAVEATDESPAVAAVEALEEAIVIRASYTLSANSVVVDQVLSGIRTQISPVSNPTFALTITVPTDIFRTLFTGDTDALIAALQGVGTIQPNAALTALIRSVAVQVIGVPQ